FPDVSATTRWWCAGLSMAGFLFIWFFFRVPGRKPPPDNQLVYAPADGIVVVLEEVMEEECLHMRCMQVSIFMSLLNVHWNSLPVSGRVVYSRYHPGKNLVACHPKSSLLNERASVAIDTGTTRIKVCQVAGLIARRIICRLKEGDRVQQGGELGFILFGSRVDLFLPLSSTVVVKLGDRVKVNRNVIARLPAGEEAGRREAGL
ncbi:MAG: phosphatidylserine decarboxylase, partial [Bacteroidales bacterium]